MSLCIKPLIVAGQDMAFMSGKDRVWQKEVHLMSNYLCGQKSALSLMLKSQNPPLLLIKINDGEGKRFSYLNDKYLKMESFVLKMGIWKMKKLKPFTLTSWMETADNNLLIIVNSTIYNQ